MKTSVADLRQNYTRAGLLEKDAADNPFDQFHTWFEQALRAELLEPNAMTLATATPEGKPSARIVLLKEYNQEGFVFYTNYTSQKGRELTANPWTSLVFWWGELERQVRIGGRAEKVSDAESDQYFHSRPLDSQLGAWASHQSQMVESREVLENRFRQLQTEYEEQGVPRPPHWGGFRVVPTEIEFWQGRPSRLHDRLRYRLDQQGNWVRERLSP
jgi:pyridoxamine 5'-phosphate oxidase